ncbi:MAG: glutamate-5-semialdehyde dehydrogenase [Clostridia bacterium]|nr:glutamate-5-semialdehyde dehydrogenase [Clostridia bacterium]
MRTLNEIGESAKIAKRALAKLTTGEKNQLLLKAADALKDNYEEILRANEIDLENGKNAGLKGSIIDRLALNRDRIYAMADGLYQIAKLPDPIGEIINMKELPNGLTVGQKRVPMGVIGIIYEARPNVTSDAFGLCLKAGSAVILRGGKEAINSNKAAISVFKKAISEMGIDENIVQLIEDTSRETAAQMMKMNGYIDVLIPRGGAGLIQSVVKNSTVPVIETGVGNCHVFVDESADIEKAVNIIVNAKAQRPGVCNAAETLIVHKNIAEEFLPKAIKALREKNVEIRGDKAVKAIVNDVVDASDEDWATEYLDYILAVKVVNDIDEAIEHITKYSTGHSECIVSENYTNTQRFLQEIDSAAVYVNASTRFTDGNEFGFGAEIGISTQKLHARGPMGLRELTTTKYLIYGNGQIRE